MDRHAEYDAIVVGSGAAGATVARELSRRGKDVLILERGGDGPVREGSLATASIMSRVTVGENLATTRAFTTGGTTTLYFAIADPPPLDVFRRLNIDLSRAFDGAKQELPLSTIPDELLGEQSLRLRESAAELGYALTKTPMLVDLSKCTNGYTPDAKWNARTYVRDAVAAGAALVTRAKALRVLSAGKRAVGVEYEVRGSKKEVDVRRAYGSKIVLAAGGAASPLILRDSGIRSVVDSSFYCHPGFGLFGIVPGLRAGTTFTAHLGMVLGGDLGIGDFNLPRPMYRMFMLGSRKFVRAFRHGRSIALGVMLKEGLGGALREDGRYHKELTREDIARLNEGEGIARRILENAGAKRVMKSQLTSAHVGGTIRIGEHVDSRLQTEYEGLHVCDGSVMPAGAKVAPTLTLICLGKYLANCLSPVV